MVFFLTLFNFQNFLYNFVITKKMCKKKLWIHKVWILYRGGLNGSWVFWEQNKSMRIIGHWYEKPIRNSTRFFYHTKFSGFSSWNFSWEFSFRLLKSCDDGGRFFESYFFDLKINFIHVNRGCESAFTNLWTKVRRYEKTFWLVDLKI